MATLTMTTHLSGGLPIELAFSAGAMIALAATVLLVGAAAAPARLPWTLFFAAWLVAGSAGVAIGLVQVFVPDAADGHWIARSSIVGRAVGNVRQPNHLATLLLWSAVAVVPLMETAAVRRHRAAGAAMCALFTLMLFGIVLSGSRTGLVGVVTLVAWGLFDRRLSRASRGLLLAAPLVCLVSWLLLGWLSSLLDTGALGASTRLGESQDYSSGRWSIWRDTLVLIARNPWLGVGFGEFNFAWTLTPFPDRNTQFFDHTHNLPLHLAVELGIPLALLVLGLLAWGLWQAFSRSRRVDGSEGVARRAALVMVLLMALHSQLEYPLWYAHFLLPTAFMWGLCLGAGAPVAASDEAPPPRWPIMVGAAMVIAAVVVLIDYRRVVVIFSPPAGAAALEERIADGQRSWFFAHHADYAAATTAERPVDALAAFKRAPHHLLDTRLMIAWAQALAQSGDVDRARYIAARLREFRNPGAEEFFAPCKDAALQPPPFQCEPPQRLYTWRDFR